MVRLLCILNKKKKKEILRARLGKANTRSNQTWGRLNYRDRRFW